MRAAALMILLTACDARGFWGDRFVGGGDPDCQQAPETCAACHSNSDCPVTYPVCDSGSQRCRGCADNSECASGVCLQESWPGDTLSAGACVPLASVCRVDFHNCGASRDGSVERPYCEIDEAVGGCSRPYLAVVAQSVGQSYRGELKVVDRALAVSAVGPGQPVLPAVTVRGDGALLLLSDVIVDHSNQPGNVVTCGAGGRLRLRQTQVRSGDVGVTADAGCQELDLSRVLVAGNDLDGIVIATGMNRYRIVNSVIADNGHNPQSNATGVTLGLGAQGTFAFNSVINNGRAQSNVSGGVYCQAAMQLTDSIIDGNSFGPPPSGQTMGSQVGDKCTLLRVALGDEGSSRPGALSGAVHLDSGYHLLDSSTCCIDQAQGDPSITVDYFGVRRPQRMGYDVGAAEAP